MGKAVIFCIIILICAFIMGSIGVWALVRKSPMHFWSGSTVKPEEIRDIPAYNRATGVMWLVFAGGYLGCAVLALFHLTAAGIAVAIWSLAGIPGLIKVYGCIYHHYKA